MSIAHALIFDLDGTLVDSEPWANQAFLNLLPQIEEPLESFMFRYVGWQFNVVLEDIERQYGQPIPDDFESDYRNEVAALCRAHLKPIAGAADALTQLNNPKCIASNGPMKKMQLSLELTDLRTFFGDHLYSAYEVRSWKPEPELFLFAADAMGKKPSDCIVIEDSTVGLTAADAAGMRSVHYCPEGISNRKLWIRHLSELPHIVNSL